MKSKADIKEIIDLIDYRGEKGEELVRALRYILEDNCLFTDKMNPATALLDCIQDEFSCIQADISHFEHLVSE